MLVPSKFVDEMSIKSRSSGIMRHGCMCERDVQRWQRKR